MDHLEDREQEDLVDLREDHLADRLVDNKVAALDQDWSSLRFVWRKGLREALARSRVKT